MGKITKRLFGKTEDGKEIFVFRLEGAGGAYSEVTNYGAVWVTTLVPDRSGALVDVCLSYGTLEGYIADGRSVGAVVGRYVNRIKGAEFTLNGVTYHLQKNSGNNSSHGGFDRYNKRVWDYELAGGAVVFRLHSPDGDQEYPGNLDVAVTYAFDENNMLSIDYEAVCDRDTPINLTNHAYFNLAGASSGADAAMAQTLRLNAGRVTELDDECVTTGRLLPVESTPFDFRSAKVVGERVDENHPQLLAGKGYDINYAVDGEGLREAAVLASPHTGISMELYITNPGVQFYSCNNLGEPFERRGAVCLEPQHYPNSVNHPQFPSSILKAGERYIQRAEYRFKAGSITG